MIIRDNLQWLLLQHHHPLCPATLPKASQDPPSCRTPFLGPWSHALVKLGRPTVSHSRGIFTHHCDPEQECRTYNRVIAKKNLNREHTIVVLWKELHRWLVMAYNGLCVPWGFKPSQNQHSSEQAGPLGQLGQSSHFRDDHLLPAQSKPFPESQWKSPTKCWQIRAQRTSVDQVIVWPGSSPEQALWSLANIKWTNMSKWHQDMLTPCRLMTIQSHGLDMVGLS